MSNYYLMTSEYVSSGHPDKVCDQISDAILDLYLRQDPNSKVACEVMIKGHDIYIAGEISSNAIIWKADILNAIHETLDSIGYDTAAGYDKDKINVTLNITEQSPEINNAVVVGDEIMAGDQGIMWGYACRDTEVCMPLPIYLAKKIIDTATDIMHGEVGLPNRRLFPDMKSQVTVRYDLRGIPVLVDNVVLSMCHSSKMTLEQLNNMFHSEILPKVIDDIPLGHIRDMLKDRNTIYHINPAGLWTVGGSFADCGLTGRKLVCDAYGADCEIGGGALSGKDGSKVDRSAAYMARFIALKVLRDNPYVDKVKVQLAYAIGRKYPVSFRVFDPTTDYNFGMAGFTWDDLTPSSIIERFNLTKPIFSTTSRIGHFGNPEFPWENAK